MNKAITVISISLLFLALGVYFLLEQNFDNSNERVHPFIECLDEAGVVIYGTPTCPYCIELVSKYDDFNGFETIYTDCSDPEDPCKEAQVSRVPKVHIDGEVFNDSGDPETLAKETGCPL